VGGTLVSGVVAAPEVLRPLKRASSLLPLLELSLESPVLLL
jgi:hypothetical protein